MTTRRADIDSEWRELVSRSRQGDRAAYNQFLSHVARFAEGYLRKKLGNADVVEDIAQEVLISVHKSLNTYDGERAIMPWVVAIMRYRYVDYIRKWARRERYEVTDDELLQKLCETFFESGTNEDIGDALGQALASLPELQRSIVEMLKIEGLSVKEVAQKIGKSEGAVKVSAHRAYKLMRKQLVVSLDYEN